MKKTVITAFNDFRDIKHKQVFQCDMWYVYFNIWKWNSIKSAIFLNKKVAANERIILTYFILLILFVYESY